MNSLNLLFICVFAVAVNGQGTQGQYEPDPTKTCLSIRLPWQASPVYFCTEPGSFKYRPHRCTSPDNHRCPTYDNDTLLVQVPWQCCPIASVPDTCGHIKCPPPPFNRTCQAIEDKQGWDCCPKYYCEDGKPEDCPLKRLEPGCMSPPKGKEECVRFGDKFGCCDKFQCKGEGKPGLCPAQAEAYRYMGRIKNSTSQSDPNSPPKRREEPSDPAPMFEDDEDDTNGPNLPIISPQRGLAKPKEVMLSFKSISGNVNNKPVNKLLPCVDDYSCPDAMKCCAPNIRAYGDGVIVEKNPSPFLGFCIPPIMNY